MAKFSIHLLLFVLLGSVYCGHSTSCQGLAIWSCVNRSVDFAFRNLNGSLPDEAFLKKNCDPLTTQIDCLIEHEKTCSLSSVRFLQREGFHKGIHNMKQLVDDICDEDSSLRKDYLQSSVCFNEHKDEFKKVLGEMQSMFGQLNRHYLMENEENSVADQMLICVKVTFSYNVIKDYIEKYCGPAASNVFVTMVNQVANMEPDQCLGDQENLDRLTELLETFRPSEENIDFNSVE